MNIKKETALIVFLTALVFLLTQSSLTGPFKLQLLLLNLLVLAIYGYSLKNKQQALTTNKTFIFLLITGELFLVGATGWFFSPFFFTLYLTAIFISFIISPVASFSFVATLIVFFSFNIGDVDLAYDFLVVLSLASVIPLSSYLRKEYLKLKESEKKILVLEQENQNYKSKVEQVLANIVNNFAVNLRQPVNDIKQITFRLKDIKEAELREKYEDRILSSSNEALDMLKKFEEESTGKKLLSNPEIS